MKNILAPLAVCLTIMVCIPGTAQNLKEKTSKASTIYVAPLQFYKYYGIKTQVLQTGEAFAGRDYNYNGTYEVGEQVKNINDVYDIVGQVPDEVLDKVNANLLARCKEYFGADKVKTWPDQTKKGSGDYDQKAIDGDFYIILSRVAWTSPVKLKTFVFNEQDKEYKMMGDMENIKLTLFEKVKAGKKGKKVKSVNKGVFFEVDPVVYHFTGDSDQNKAAQDFITTKGNQALIDKVNELIDEFFAGESGS